MDIKFTIHSGDYQGDTYRYILAMDSGRKRWMATPVYKPPPSRIKEKIDMVISVRENNISYTGAQELRLVNNIIDELRRIADDTDATMVGLDGRERYVQIDEDGYSIMSVVNEHTREPEYQITLSCWGLYPITAG